MSNLKDYLRCQGQLPLTQLALTELDVACLNELGYLSFGDYLPEQFDFQRFHAFSDLVALVGQDKLNHLTYDFLVTKDRVELLQLVLSSPRFAGLEIGYYVNEVNREYEQQFAAMVMRLPVIDYHQLVFRGTDDTLVGWKEDFNMSYIRTIPAQYAASRYLRVFLDHFEGKLVISGHSKGGNLALYATSHLTLAAQKKIAQIVVFDAPGLHKSVLTSPGYRAIQHLVLAFRPPESIVGIILQVGVTYQTVASSAKGLLQHDMLTWLIQDEAFVRVDGLSEFSLTLEKTFSDWLATHSNRDLKLFFDTFFDLFFTSGIVSLNDLNKGTPEPLKQVLANLASLDHQQREFMVKAVRQLLTIYQKHAVEAVWSNRPQLFGESLGQWLSRPHPERDESRTPR